MPTKDFIFGQTSPKPLPLARSVKTNFPRQTTKKTVGHLSREQGWTQRKKEPNTRRPDFGREKVWENPLQVSKQDQAQTIGPV